MKETKELVTEIPPASGKKKRNRKKKKKKSNGDASEVSKPQSPTEVVGEPEIDQEQLLEAAKMNPHARVCHQLMAEGFTIAEIQTSMEEMWDQNLAYDDYHAVLSYLKRDKDEKGPGRGVEESKEGEQDTEEHASNFHCLLESRDLTTGQKLEQLAMSKDIREALVSFSRWIETSSTTEEAAGLFQETNSKAMGKLFHVALISQKDVAAFSNSVVPPLVSIMSNILRKQGVAPAQISQSESSLQMLWKKAHAMCLEGGNDDSGLASRTADLLVSQLSQSLAGNQTNGNVAAKPPPAAAKKKAKSKRNKSNGQGTSSSSSASAIMASLVGEGFRDAYELQKGSLDELEAQARETESERAEELRANVEDLEEERAMIQQRIQELKQSIEKLETYDAELCVKLNDANAELLSETALVQVESTSLHEKIAEIRTSIKYGNMVSGFADALTQYTGELDKATASKS